MGRQKIIGVILGSIREGRVNDRVARWVTGQLERHGFATRLIDPADPGLLPVQIGDKAAIGSLHQRMQGLDGFVIVTPEYNHAEPGPLKTLIDSSGPGWFARPVGLISYGGMSGGLRAIEALRIILAELHTVTLRDTVSFVSPWRRIDEAGRIADPEDAAAVEAAMAVFAHRLDWWADALAVAREGRPYDPEEG
ncbi:MAG: NADPH-dependent FMN reductase [Paracoccus sp. (in: a-proteobacteria)]|jgi:NAD(P)H-dependent FMN reductase|uniref:NADPH-dependent FMN reductase n=1 Tax=unclassified Paracoccus (in: a-proteobacteria) TaxID=2688777 RepID=UPI000C55517C|nr:MULTISPECIES: NAD(P)H-dependent oxidoreductase [unclassified Paracoccus (in: a-proteobacteria)]MAN56082.1 FMN reductase [Paracoccus sp. (in: a-proteobacteria)]MBA50464.1 FMN reductase [Paracoccus sp. (in: a-proteobacteria)]HIC66017.1 NADPH-dependent oxidoreductase [Paracoccus sp. (in: a-proteobacteria)]|tara:strand:- start:180 stop:761 length:582 start_codon:yes stop_codon:yes gene_type:complete